MDKISRKHGRIVRGASYLGIYIGYLGMIVIVGFMLYGLYQIFFVPNAPPPIQPVIPGVDIPGSAIKVPLIIGWIALFISAAIHEFSHGVVARSHNLKVKSSGFAFIGPLAAAFVEPDEKQLQKSRLRIQNSVYAAGPFSNMILGALMVLLLLFVLMPTVNHYLQPEGFKFESLTPDYPAEIAGLEPGIIYTTVEGNPVMSHIEFYRAVENATPNQTVMIGNSDGEFAVITTSHPEDPAKGYFGVINTRTHFTNENTIFAAVLLWLLELVNWIFIISLGLGLANLLPIGPVDGGRLFQTASYKFFGKKRGKKIWGYVTLFFLGLIIILFYPIFKAIFLEIVKLFIPALAS